jgi:hypothetical protein
VKVNSSVTPATSKLPLNPVPVPIPIGAGSLELLRL